MLKPKPLPRPLPPACVHSRPGSPHQPLDTPDLPFPDHYMGACIDELCLKRGVNPGRTLNNQPYPQISAKGTQTHCCPDFALYRGCVDVVECEVGLKWHVPRREDLRREVQRGARRIFRKDAPVSLREGDRRDWLESERTGRRGVAHVERAVVACTHSGAG
jgi:hypothetical protein